MRLLVVEDEKIILNGIVKHIPWEALGIDELRSARNAEEALAVFEEFSPDIVLTDINMPGKDGIAMCHDMKEKNEDVQIILITGYSQMDYLKRA
ncbi:MAG: response regulator, partial [Lachnospiraceae bacterium]|nr:response regulator [Lachnospiraceae bacterium]